MKECPYCKAQIEDNARFCLYCMKPLTEKEIIPPQKKDMRWLFAVVGILLVIGFIWLLPDKKRPQIQDDSLATASSAPAMVVPSVAPSAEPTVASTPEPTAATTATPTKGENTSATQFTTEPTGSLTPRPTVSIVKPGASPTTTPTTKPANTPTSTTSPAATSAPTVFPTTNPTTAPVTTPSAKPTTAPTSAPAIAPTTEPVPTYVWEEEETGIVYTYRQAVQEDVLGVPYEVTEDDVVILRVRGMGSRSSHAFPATVGDNKKVVALGEYVYGKNIYESYLVLRCLRRLFLPNGLVAFHPHAITHRLSTVYVCGEYLARGEVTDTDFNGIDPTFTKIYCTEACQDEFGRKYAQSYIWEAWSKPDDLAFDRNYFWTDPETGIRYQFERADPKVWKNSSNKYRATSYEIELKGISTVGEDGICRIPSHILGYPVSVVWGLSIDDSIIKEIYLPDTVELLEGTIFNRERNRPIHIYTPRGSLECDLEYVLYKPEEIYLHFNWKG